MGISIAELSNQSFRVGRVELVSLSWFNIAVNLKIYDIAIHLVMKRRHP